MRYTKIGDREWLEKQIDVKPLRQVAEEVGCSYSAVVYQVKKFGLVVPQRFSRRQSPGKSENIKKTLRERYPEGRFGNKASNWKGGRRMSGGGHVQIYQPQHPYATKNGLVMEHRLVMEKELGRYLEPGEIVHHKNHIKDDNRPENLEVVNRGEHVRNHFNEPIQLQKRIEYLEALLKANNIDYN